MFLERTVEPQTFPPSLPSCLQYVGKVFLRFICHSQIILEACINYECSVDGLTHISIYTLPHGSLPNFHFFFKKYFYFYLTYTSVRSPELESQAAVSSRVGVRN